MVWLWTLGEERNGDPGTSVQCDPKIGGLRSRPCATEILREYARAPVPQSAGNQYEVL